jgi:6-phosphogluconolactonase
LTVDIRVVEDPAREVAGMLAAAAAAGEQIVMTGGSTPRRAYELAAREQDDWSDAVLWFGDERCVPADHELSNHRLVHDGLVSRLANGRRPQVLRMEGELGPERGAGAYEALVRERMGSEPRWDLLLLGLGPDSHCASLFPGKPEVEERSRFVTGVALAGWEPQVPRITMTLPCLNAARRVVFLVTGAEKATAMRRAFGDPPDEASPAAHVRPSSGELLVLCDPPAAGDLGT